MSRVTLLLRSYLHTRQCDLLRGTKTDRQYIDLASGTLRLDYEMDSR